VEANVAEGTEFDEFVAARSPHLLRLAYLSTRNVSTAQDLLQDAFLKSWFPWPRITTDPQSYVRKVLVNSYVSGLRRMWHRELPSDFLPEGRHTDQTDLVTTRLALWQALGQLPRRQRALIVLRYNEDLGEAQAAAVLGCGIGTVKSQTSRALAKRRVDQAWSLSTALSCGTFRPSSFSTRRVTRGR
jgi:RNA polymerase sigma-70 factor (sigma-E family)